MSKRLNWTFLATVTSNDLLLAIVDCDGWQRERLMKAFPEAYLSDGDAPTPPIPVSILRRIVGIYEDLGDDEKDWDSGFSLLKKHLGLSEVEYLMWESEDKRARSNHPKNRGIDEFLGAEEAFGWESNGPPEILELHGQTYLVLWACSNGDGWYFTGIRARIVDLMR